MRVALDEQIFAIQAYGGISRMFAELARQFAEHRIGGAELLPLEAPIVTRYVLEDARLAAALQVTQAKNEWWALARYFARPRIHPRADVLHNTFYLPHGLSPSRGAKRIVTVHDMIPELMPATRRRLDLLTLKHRYVRTADHVICVSEATKSDLLRVYPDVEAPISVIHHGVDPRFRPDLEPLPDLPERYVLMVGNRGQYKDGDTLVRAFARIAGDHDDLQLLCIGGGPWNRRERDMLSEAGIERRALQTSLSDARMPAAYANAAAFVFPSRFEGFGLPALEAMACGAPTVLAQATSLPEVGGDAAWYFPPGDDVALSEVLASILARGPEVEERRERALSRASEFTWQRAAEATAAAYVTALG